VTVREFHVPSSDGTTIHVEVSGQGPTAILFVHGWLGSTRWWRGQEEAFASDYQVILVDLAGHGQSGKNRTTWSIDAYADDILAAARCGDFECLVLVGHWSTPSRTWTG